jgi:hypothetical protein
VRLTRNQDKINQSASGIADTDDLGAQTAT